MTNLLGRTLLRNTKTKSHFVGGQIHGADKALPVSRHQNQPADVTRIEPFSVAHQKRCICARSVESTHHEKAWAASTAFQGEGIFSRLKHTLLPMYFVSESEDTVYILSNSQRWMNG